MKKLVSVFLIFIVIISITNIVFASHKIEPKYFGANYRTDMSEVKEFGGFLLGLIRNIAAGALVCIIAFIGLKTMIGSVEERADYKKSITPLLVGVVIVLSSSSFTKILWDFSNNTTCNHPSVSTCTGICTTCQTVVLKDARGYHVWDEFGQCEYCLTRNVDSTSDCVHVFLYPCSDTCSKCKVAKRAPLEKHEFIDAGLNSKECKVCHYRFDDV